VNVVTQLALPQLSDLAAHPPIGMVLPSAVKTTVPPAVFGVTVADRMVATFSPGGFGVTPTVVVEPTTVVVEAEEGHWCRHCWWR